MLFWCRLIQNSISPSSDQKPSTKMNMFSFQLGTYSIRSISRITSTLCVPFRITLGQWAQQISISLNSRGSTKAEPIRHRNPTSSSNDRKEASEHQALPLLCSRPLNGTLQKFPPQPPFSVASTNEIATPLFRLQRPGYHSALGTKAPSSATRTLQIIHKHLLRSESMTGHIPDAKLRSHVFP